MKNATKNNTSVEDNAGQIGHLAHILWCVQHFTVSRTLLCPTHYCVKQNTVSTLIQKIFSPPFTFQHAAVVLCACEASLSLSTVSYLHPLRTEVILGKDCCLV